MARKVERTLRQVIAGDVNAVASDIVEVLTEAQHNTFGWFQEPPKLVEAKVWDAARIAFKHNGRTFSLTLKLESGGGK